MPQVGWVPETGPAPSSEPTYATDLVLHPKRVSGEVIISLQLLRSSPDAQTIITTDLQKAIGNQIDYAALYGSGINDQPLGIVFHPATHKLPIALATAWNQTTELAYLTQLENANPETFGWLVSPLVYREYERTMVSNGGTDSISTRLPRLISTATITDVRAFAGCWSSLVVGLFATEIVVDVYSQSASGKVRIICNSFLDIAIRYPKSLGVLS